MSYFHIPTWFYLLSQREKKRTDASINFTHTKSVGWENSLPFSNKNHLEIGLNLRVVEREKGKRDEGNEFPFHIICHTNRMTLFMVFLLLLELIRRGKWKCILALLNLMAMLVSCYYYWWCLTCCISIPHWLL